MAHATRRLLSYHSVNSPLNYTDPSGHAPQGHCADAVFCGSGIVDQPSDLSEELSSPTIQDETMFGIQVTLAESYGYAVSNNEGNRATEGSPGGWTLERVQELVTALRYAQRGVPVPLADVIAPEGDLVEIYMNYDEGTGGRIDCNDALTYGCTDGRGEFVRISPNFGGSYVDLFIHETAHVILNRLAVANGYQGSTPGQDFAEGLITSYGIIPEDSWGREGDGWRIAVVNTSESHEIFADMFLGFVTGRLYDYGYRSGCSSMCGGLFANNRNQLVQWAFKACP